MYKVTTQDGPFWWATAHMRSKVRPTDQSTDPHSQKRTQIHLSLETTQAGQTGMGNGTRRHPTPSGPTSLRQ